MMSNPMRRKPVKRASFSANAIDGRHFVQVFLRSMVCVHVSVHASVRPSVSVFLYAEYVHRNTVRTFHEYVCTHICMSALILYVCVRECVRACMCV